MSLLLDALKKSDAERKRGELPSVDLSVSTPSAPTRRRRWPFALLGGSVLVALLAIAVWRIPAPSSNAEPSLSTRPEAATGPEAIPQVELAPKPSAGAATAVTVSEPGNDSAQPVAARASDPQPANREAASAEGPATARQTAAKRPEARQPAASESAASPPNLPARPSPDQLAERMRELAPEPERPVERPRPPATVPGEAGGESAATEPERKQDWIRPWELPQAERARFPELRLSVHYYTENPRDRFVLINGERRTQGAALGQGARLLEIRRRGVIVEFGDYRILIE